MARDAERGFTIIEVVLFLAITGAIFAALMIGVNNGVTQQRYLDSVRSYKSIVQGQYAEVVNTRNEKVGATCADSGANQGLVEGDTTVSRDASRGTSSCVLLGRAIRVSDGNTITTSSITGIDNGTRVPSNLADIDLLTTYYHAKLSKFDEEKSLVDWGSQLVNLETGGRRDASNAAILIIRSPATGLIRVFATDDPNHTLDTNGDLTPFLNTASSTTVLKNCVGGNSGLLPKQKIVIDPRIASPDAVAITDDPEGECRI